MTNKDQIRKITLTAILSTILVVLAFLPIKTLGLEITLTIIPIAIGGIIGGVWVGTILGTIFGLISFIQCFGYSAFGVVLLDISPLMTFLVCLPTRILVGFIPALLYKVLKAKNIDKNIASGIACVLTPVLNTVLFMSVLVLGFYNTEYIQGFVDYLGAKNPFTFVILFVGINGLVEIICAVVVTFPVVKALDKYIR